MMLFRKFPAFALLFVLLSMVCLSIAQESPGQLLVAGTLACMSWFITEGPRGRAVPGWVSKVLVIGLTLHVFVQVVRLPGPQPLIDEMGHFALWLSIIKLYERKTPRDYTQLFALCLLMMVGGCMRSSTLNYGAALVGTVLLGVFVTMLHQLYTGYEYARSERDKAHPTGYRFHLPIKPGVGRHGVLHLRGVLSAVVMMALLFSVLIFFAIPRNLGRSLIRDIGTSVSNRTTGYDDSVDLLEGGRITESRNLVGTLKVERSSGVPTLLRTPLHLRGAVLDNYQKPNHWTQWKHRQITNPLRIVGGRLTPLIPTVTPDIPGITLHLDFVEPNTTLFSAWTPIAIASKNTTLVTYNKTSRVLVSDASSPLQQYSVRVVKDAPPSLREAIFPGESRANRAEKYQNPRVTKLAQRLLAVAGLPYAPSQASDRASWTRSAVSVMMRHLQFGGFEYTLDLSDLDEPSSMASRRPALDLTERFLLQTRRGHCEYFASGLVALCQAVNIPARLVTGYLVTRYDENTGQYIILQSDAHAWVEIRTEHFLWETFDPTPPGVLNEIHSPDNSLADRLRWMYQQAEGDWKSGVIGFDRNSQSNLADSFLSRWRWRIREFWSDLTDWMASVNRAFYFGPVGYIWMGIVGFALIIAVVALFKLRRRVRTIRESAHLEHVHGSTQRRLLHHLGFYVDMLAVLERAKQAKPLWQPPRLYAATHLEEQPEIAARVEEITDLFYRVRYSDYTPDRDELHQARDLVTGLANSLGVHP